MRYNTLSLLILLLLVMVAGCNSKQTQSIDKESFPTEKAALTHFIQNEKSGDDIESVQTMEGDELFIVRSGNHQYSVYGKANEDNGYSVKKLTATLSLHNTISGGAEFTGSNGKEYTFLVAKQLDGLNYPAKSQNEFHKIFSEGAYIAVSKGHILGKSEKELSTNVIQTTETVQDSSS